MSEFVVRVPKTLKGDEKRIELKVRELVSLEEKRKMISLFFDELMEGAKQLKEEEVIALGREIKRGRFDKLRAMGLV